LQQLQAAHLARTAALQAQEDAEAEADAAAQQEAQQQHMHALLSEQAAQDEADALRAWSLLQSFSAETHDQPSSDQHRQQQQVANGGEVQPPPPARAAAADEAGVAALQSLAEFDLSSPPRPTAYA
jgi:hypothetical protein